jgi:hypothetical protein
MIVVAACGGGDGDRDGEEDGRKDADERALPDAVCDSLDDLDELEQTLLPPDVFELDSVALEEALVARRALLDDLAAGTDGELQDLLADQLTWQAAFDATMLDGWDQDRVRLADAHDDAWMNVVLDDSVTGEDGENVTLSTYSLVTTWSQGQLVVSCRAPELAGGPVQERTEDAPPGRLVFLRPIGHTNPDGVGADNRMVATDPSGRYERDLAPQDPWLTLGWLDTDPTGDDGILVGTQEAADDDGDGDSREFGTVITGSDGEVLDVVERGPGQLACPAWNPGSDQVLGAGNSSVAGDRRLWLADLAGERPTGDLDLPFASVGCSDFVDDDRLVIGDAALDPDDDRGVWTVGVDGSDPRELYAPEGCATAVGAVDPTGTRVTVTQTCFDLRQSGLWVVDLSSGEADQVAVGRAGGGKWSPDGEWLVFGFSPLGESPFLGVWEVRADGHQLRQVIEPPAFSPVWLPPT